MDREEIRAVLASVKPLQAVRLTFNHTGTYPPHYLLNMQGLGKFAIDPTFVRKIRTAGMVNNWGGEHNRVIEIRTSEKFDSYDNAWLVEFMLSALERVEILSSSSSPNGQG